MKVEDFLKQNKIEQEIDAVYPIKKIRIDEDSVLLYLEDEKIRISDEAYFSYGIKNLKGLDEELYQKLKDDETLFKAYKSCLRKLRAGRVRCCPGWLVCRMRNDPPAMRSEEVVNTNLRLKT